jgi:hypothetical protein
LRGIAIGNGWIDPKTQYQGYVDFAYEKGLIKEGSKVRQHGGWMCVVLFMRYIGRSNTGTIYAAVSGPT